MDKVRFFGTTGDKDLMFANSLTAGGVYFEMNGKKIIMDPGPGTFNSFVNAFPREVINLDAIILSHVHFDHSTDVNTMIEGMTNGGSVKRGMLITSEFAFNGESKVIHGYLKSFPEKVWLVDKELQNHLGNLILNAVEHQHGIPNFGFIFTFDKKKISVVTDTRFFDGIIEAYARSTTMIVNVPYSTFPEGTKPKHLCIANVKEIIKKIKPQKVILTHFGRSMFEAGVDTVARELGNQMGIEVVAAEKDKEYTLQ